MSQVFYWIFLYFQFAIFDALGGELHDAVRANNGDLVMSLLAEGADVDESDFLLGTALHVAVSEGRHEIARLLIGNGADLEAVSEQQGSRAMHRP